MHLMCNTVMYADDTTLHESAKSLSTIQVNLQTNLLKVQSWCKTNNMIINPIKTTCMVIGSTHKLKQNCNMSLSISGNNICNVQTQTFLGLYIDNTLSWKLHIDSVCAKMSSRSFLLKKIKPYLTIEMRKLFYNGYTCISTLSDYASINWSHAAKSDLVRLGKLQKRACTYILNKKVKTSTELTKAHKELNLLSFSNIVHYFTSLMVFKPLHNLTPALLSPSLNDNYSLRSYSKGNLKLSTIPNTNYFKRTFSYSSINVWNTVPPSFKT